MPRPRIDLEDDELEDVYEYAKNNGLRLPRAYGDLIRTGLEATKEGDA